MARAETGFVAFYRWRIKEGHEDAFVSAWTRLTELIRERQGGRGSRLHRGEDGLFYAYAQWPDRASWAAEWSLPPEADDVSSAMGDAIAERLEPILLTPVGDLLVPEGTE